MTRGGDIELRDVDARLIKWRNKGIFQQDLALASRKEFQDLLVGRRFKIFFDVTH